MGRGRRAGKKKKAQGNRVEKMNLEKKNQQSSEKNNQEVVIPPENIKEIEEAEPPSTVQIQNTKPIEVRLLTDNRPPKSKLEKKDEASSTSTTASDNLKSVNITLTPAPPPKEPVQTHVHYTVHPHPKGIPRSFLLSSQIASSGGLDTLINNQSDTATNANPHEVICIYCLQWGHDLTKCSTFASKTIVDRMLFARQQKWCFRCFEVHMQYECPSTRRCSLCNLTHHELFCRSLADSVKDSAVENKSVTASDTNANEAALCRYCKERSHKVTSCPEFSFLGFKVRRSVARKRKWCFLCLEPHAIDECSSSTKRCSMCKMAHHELFCGQPMSIVKDTAVEKNQSNTASNANANEAVVCVCCQQKGHKIAECSSFVSMTITDRMDLARRLKLCFLCFETHLQNECRSTKKCSLCQLAHHELLCGRLVFAMKDTESNQSTTASNASASEAVFCSYCKRQDHKLSECSVFAAIPVKDRRGVARELKWCFLCLEPHLRSACSNTRVCSLCKKSHHELICGGTNTALKEKTVRKNLVNVWSSDVEAETADNATTSVTYPSVVTLSQDEDNSTTKNKITNVDKEPKTGVSAFKRLGPVIQDNPKKPKLTINLSIQKSKREVVESIEKPHVPVHLRPHIINSTDEIVTKFLPLWPWKRDITNKTVTAKPSKTAMLMEQEFMEEKYSNKSRYFQVTVTGYPSTWTKEDVFDAIFDKMKGNVFIPCFIEHSHVNCKFLLIASRQSLMQIHNLGFVIKVNDSITLSLSISLTTVVFGELGLLPKNLVVRRLIKRFNGLSEINLKEFLAEEDVSNFVYFPLSRITNQIFIMQLKNDVKWERIVDLDLSYNKISDLEGFDLPRNTPKLKHLNLSHNFIDNISTLSSCKGLPLSSIKLEGNPLCLNYIDADHYVKVIRLMFPMVLEIDGVAVHLKGDLPETKKYYCPVHVQPLVNRFLEMYFSLLEAKGQERESISGMYRENAVLTVTNTIKLRYDQKYKNVRKMFSFSRSFEDGDTTSIDGAAAIAFYISNWPLILHDPFTYTIDVLEHNDSSTLLRVGGIVKLKTKLLADDEILLAFTRTILLSTRDGVLYKISNELLHWDEPYKDFSYSAFQVTTTLPKCLSTKLESAPDEELKTNLIEIMKRLTNLNKEKCERCLISKDWDIKRAIEYFIKLLKLDNLSALS